MTYAVTFTVFNVEADDASEAIDDAMVRVASRQNVSVETDDEDCEMTNEEW